jgi:hypothetical protein
MTRIRESAAHELREKHEVILRKNQKDRHAGSKRGRRIWKPRKNPESTRISWVPGFQISLRVSCGRHGRLYIFVTLVPFVDLGVSSSLRRICQICGLSEVRHLARCHRQAGSLSAEVRAGLANAWKAILQNENAGSRFTRDPALVDEQQRLNCALPCRLFEPRALSFTGSSRHI